MNMINIKLTLFGTHCNAWPNIKVSLNNNIYYDGPVIDTKVINIAQAANTHNILTIEHYGKSFGSNNIWDTKVDKFNTIYEDRAVKILDLELNDVSLKKYITTIPFKGIETYYTDYFGHNGIWTLDFDAPVYDWIIKKFIIPPNTKPLGYVNETSHSNIFDYSLDFIEIKEIEEYLKEYASITDKFTKI